MNNNFKILAMSVFLVLGLTGNLAFSAANQTISAAQRRDHESKIYYGKTEMSEWYSSDGVIAHFIPLAGEYDAYSTIFNGQLWSQQLPNAKLIFFVLKDRYLRRESGAAAGKE